MRVFKLLLSVFVAVLTGIAAASTGVIKLTTYPAMAVADARSTVTVTAEVRDLNGRLVPNGTQILFESTLGSFRENVVSTVSGYARATLVSGAIAGTAKITASAISLNAASTTELEYVTDRSLLSTAKEYIEVIGPEYLMYGMDQKIIAASGPNKGVHVRYRDVEIEADDVQVMVPTYEVRARKARLKIGSFEGNFEELYIALNTRRGYGTTTFKAKEVMLAPVGLFFRLVETEVERLRFGLVSVNASGVQPLVEDLPSNQFEFSDLGESSTKISAKKAVAFPRKEIQFQKADIYMGDVRVMKLPLFQVSLIGGTPLLTDQVINVDNNQLAVNYPHYLSLKPGETSLLRFRMGNRYNARGLGSDRAPYLDYELNWNRGEDMDGGMTVSGIGRSDWGVNVHQYVRVDDRTSAFAHADLTSMRNLFGSGNVSRQFDGFQVSLSGNANTTIRGLEYSNQQYALVAEKDPTKVGKLPVRLYYGLVATHSAVDTSSFSTTQTGAGLRARAQLLPVSLDRNTSLHASLAVSHLSGHNTAEGLTLNGSANLSRRITNDASVLLTYDYSQDAFNSLIGNHRLSAQGTYYGGRTSLNVFGSRSLDADRMNYFADATYRISGIWRVAYSYTFDRFLGESVTDYNIALIYRFGWRDFGVTFSQKTKRLGIQVLGTTFN
jgi:hypothetical protein